MNYRTIALIGARLLAIWLIVLGIGALPQIAELWRFPFAAKVTTAVHWFMTGEILMLIAPLILGLILWAIAPWLSRRLAPAGENEPPAASPMLIQGAIAIAGLVVAVTALPNLIYEIVNLALLSGESAPTQPWLWTKLIVEVILVLLGLAMFVGARRLRDLIYRLRDANT